MKWTMITMSRLRSTSLIQVVLVSILLSLLCSSQAQHQCRSPKETCMQYNHCANTNATMPRGKLKTCGVQNNTRFVCCKNVNIAPDLPTPAPIPRPTQALFRSRRNALQKCAQPYNIAEPTIAGGSQAPEGNSPWHVAIFNKTKTLICGGTIIHELLVISAAHCFMEDPEKGNVEDYEVVVAKHTKQHNTIDNQFQKGYKLRQIRFPSSGYEGSINYYQGDIAILVLTEKIIMSSHVMPACVNWEALKSGKRPPTGTLGKVVGWGLTEHGNESTHLRTVDLPIMDTINCRKAVHENFLPFITSDKFCAGTGNHTGPSVLQGDSGGGILFVERGGYYLQGVVSVKQRASNSISLFTDLHSHAHTILEMRDHVDKELFATTTAILIAQQQCKKYAEYRYVTKDSIRAPNSSSKQHTEYYRSSLVGTAIPRGVRTKPKEHPHMALIGFEITKHEQWLCGGSLISEKFILAAKQNKYYTMAVDSDVGLSVTAAMVSAWLKNKTIPENSPKFQPNSGSAKWAYLGLGDHNMTREEDEKMQAIYGIAKFHESADIVLYELDATVAINPYVRPACIHTSANIPVNTAKNILGWKSDENYELGLLNANISVLDEKECRKVYPDDKYSKPMICAGNSIEGSNTCLGGAGIIMQVPVDKQPHMWSILGVGFHEPVVICANEVSRYTIVAHYLDWIQRIVWPELSE